MIGTDLTMKELEKLCNLKAYIVRDIVGNMEAEAHDRPYEDALGLIESRAEDIQAVMLAPSRLATLIIYHNQYFSCSYEEFLSEFPNDLVR